MAAECLFISHSYCCLKQVGDYECLNLPEPHHKLILFTLDSKNEVCDCEELRFLCNYFLLIHILEECSGVLPRRYEFNFHPAGSVANYLIKCAE